MVWFSLGLCFVVARLFSRVLGIRPFHSQDVLVSEADPIAESDATHFSKNVSSCPGYLLNFLQESRFGLVAQLSLAGAPCNAFGTDFEDLTIQVTYETDSRLRVRIADSGNKQFTIPESVIARPPPPTTSFTHSSDLVFNYEPSPFSFWITRRSNPDATPLFDTRFSSLPKPPLAPVIPDDNSTALDGFSLVFEDQYLQLTSSLPLDANIYGLGEVIASSGFRRNVASNGGSIQTLWARDIADPIDQNMYGNHPVYVEHRFNETTNEAQSHGVFLFSSSGADILLLTPPGASQSLVQYRMIGGVFDFYFFSGPTPHAVIEQYGALVGLPSWIPSWAFGFHLCRWGYISINETMDQVQAMRAANIPLEVMWNDIDLYHAFRDFTSDPVSFPGDAMRAFIQELASNNQHYIPILDAAVPHPTNATDVYDPYIRGHELDTFVKNPDGSEYIGKVWPGYTVFPDWFADDTQQWWTESLKNWSDEGVEYSGIWLDMNEISSFCQGSCGTGADLSDTSVPFPLPGSPGALVTDYPECYDSSVSGPSGNFTVNGALTCTDSNIQALLKRGEGAGGEQGVSLNAPPYAIHNGIGDLSINTLATNATHAGGFAELDVHNMWGMMEEKATHLALQQLQPGKRPVIIARSTFPSSGKWAGHWLGDNFSKWEYLYYNIQGILQFQIFQIPFVGADTCGFNGNTDEELCNRWMQLSAFVPFYRNHNERGALSQEPYRWDSVANASRTAIATRYTLLPYWTSLFANASLRGTPPVRALWYEFPTEAELFSVDKQFLVGADILVTPVLTPNVSTVEGIFPGRGQVTWRDYYTHKVVDVSSNGTATLSAPLGHINVHIRGGSALLLHANPGYTTTETRGGPFSLLVSLESNEHAFGTAYIDDGVTNPPTESRNLTFSATAGHLAISSNGNFAVEQKLQQITILGVTADPTDVSVSGITAENWQFIPELQKLVIYNLALDLNGAQTVSW
ncbi:glycosyl hydrolases family 31-domain-containing protein [Lentinula edodes]|uniref:glycosyl hydrolases family 31-domain-containing protein n=1 Tax=Lentinula edodes TaxID=5353 RepID=UPI001E8EE586|nr:glycosyl hydrolases family 31-domain-containing protein [Lentinula edodes]KAH7869303.1 glycosyl hydrolases family 31-domain-containing protein [Lentinula edodes]KAJ3901913.1 glycosyl hydrolases family 31-domain-containing protein [Lentinula edodes]